MKGSFRQAAQRLKCWGGVALTALLLGGCSSDDADVTPGDGAMNVTLETEEVTSATVRIGLNAEQVEAFAYQLVADGEIPDAATILRVNPHHTPDNGHATLNIQYLEAQTDYTLAVAAIGGAGGEQTLLETIDFTTLPLDNILTITGMEKSALTFRIACGDNQYWKYTFLTYLDYLDRKASPFWPYDSRFLDTRAEPLKGPQTIVFPVDEYTQILPGQSYILLVGECDAEGNFLYERTDGGGGGGALRRRCCSARRSSSSSFRSA